MQRFIRFLILSAGIGSITAPALAQDKPFVPDSSSAPTQQPLAWDGDKPFMPEMHDPVAGLKPVLPPELLTALKRTALAAFNIADLSVQEMLVGHAGSETVIPVTIDGENRIIRLQPFTMRAPDAKLLVQTINGLVDTPWPEPRTYRGVAEGMDADVAASIIDGKVSMMILPRDPAQPSWFVQPLTDAVPGMPSQAHVVYRSTDVLPTDAACGVDEFNGHPGAQMQPQPPGVPLGQRLQQLAPAAAPIDVNKPDAEEGGVAGEGGIAVANIRVQIAYDADVEFYQANGSSVLNTIYDMELIMNQVGLIYQNQVAIAYTDTGIIVRTVEPDPYSATEVNALICQFGENWNINNYFTRDVAHLFSGKDFDGSTVGYGWIGAVCAGNFNNCNPSGSALNYSIVQSRFTTDLTSRVQDTAHELGHNWNACHCNTGGNCGGGTSNPACGIMTSNISGQTTFDPAALSAITSYRDSRPCLDVWQNPTYVNNTWGGFENGSISNPWNTIFEGLDACLVGGSLIVQAGNYNQNPNIFKAKTITAVNGTVKIGF